jgi:subtilisin family serine protease
MRRTGFQIAMALVLVATGIRIGAAFPGGGDAWAAPDAAQGSAKANQQAEVGETDRWVVEFEAEADLAGADGIADRRARGRFVRDGLVRTAERSQAAALRLVADTSEAEATSFWLRNTMIVEGGDAELVAALRGLDGVSAVRKERIYPLIEPVPDSEVIEVAQADPVWGIDRIGAPAAWDLGVTGGGIVVANVDTGVDLTHEAVVAQYRGTLGDGGFVHDYNWWDPTGICGDAPCDNVGHGTHTMGTMVGGDGPGPSAPDVGVAPGARWIAAKGCEEFWCSEFALLSSGQFVLAPTDLSGAAPDPGRAPHIVNNSWGGGPGDEFYLDVVRAWRAAGIVPVFSSGNPGPYCGEGGSPGDYLESLSVGATDSDDLIAEFSGRGPSAFGKLNPDVAAPGVDVVSSVPGGGYEAYSGTSMAAPHVAGTLALMLSAEPALIGDVDSAIEYLTGTALGIADLSCGGDESGVPNNVYGHGRIDAAAAVELVASGGTLTGTITDAETGDPIGGARITVTGPERTSSTFSAGDGSYRLLLQPGSYVVGAAAFGYETGLAVDVEIVTDETAVADLALVPLPRYAVSGRVTSAETGDALVGATVRAVGTPLDPVTTDRRGGYTITLPVGTHLLEASQGGCLQRDTAEVEVVGPVTQDLALARKLDRFGHGCEEVRYQPAKATTQALLYGDDSYGRLRLPFAFPFYGERYEAVFVDTNGYLAFEDPQWSEYYNTPIPSPWLPNAAIYALWQDLVVDQDSEVTYALSGNAAVIAYTNLRTFDGADRIDLQVELHRDGVIDVRYGDGTAAVGGGARATIGLEDHTGTDAFPFGFRERLLTDRTAIRYERVATSTIRGTVTNANDGLPVVGATVRATPGGQTARTGEDGTYELRVLASTYTVEASAEHYVSATQTVSVRRDRTVTVDFALAAARADVAPASLSASAEAGATVTESVTIANTGSAPLTFDVRERDLGRTPPDLPPVEPTARLVHPAQWQRPEVAPGIVPQVAGEVSFDESLEPVVEDPAGDALGAVDVVAIHGGMDDYELALGLEFTAGTPMNEVYGFVYLDVDQDPTTGIPPEALDGKPTQDIGVDFFVNLSVIDGDAWVVDTRIFEVVAVVPLATDGTMVRFDVPLDVLRLWPDQEIDGIDLAAVLGDWERPTDWVPDIGHGTVEPYRDAAWMAVEPVSGTVPVGSSVALEVALGGEDVAAGTYTGQLVVRTNDPRQPLHRVEVEFEAILAEGFGAVGGTVTDAMAGEPLAGALLELTAPSDAGTYRTSAVTDVDGRYQLLGPAGTWPVEVTAEGYVDTTVEATIVAGRQATLDVTLEPAVPRAVLEGAPLTFSVVAGGGDVAELTLRNEGVVDLEFALRERLVLPGPALGRAGTPPRGVTTQRAPRRARAVTVEPVDADAAVLVLMDALPWESTALLDVLAANGVTPDVAGSAELGSLDLDGYDVVVVANDQPQALYDAYGEHLDGLGGFVEAGGLLWVEAASFGWNDGSFAGAGLPGGVTILEEVAEEENQVSDPEHPAMSGIPEIFSGSAASHSAFDDLLPGTRVVAVGVGSELPTFIEYELGAGRVLATGQTFEYAFDHGQDAGQILLNLVPYVAAWTRAVDIPWLTLDPTDGVVGPGEAQTITVAVDTAELEVGLHEGLVIVVTNDPWAPRIPVPVVLEVLPAG